MRGHRAREGETGDDHRETFHRRSGTRANDLALGITALASVASHCSSTEQ